MEFKREDILAELKMEVKVRKDEYYDELMTIEKMKRMLDKEIHEDVIDKINIIKKEKEIAIERLGWITARIEVIEENL